MKTTEWYKYPYVQPPRSGHYLVTIENTRHKSMIHNSRTFVEILFFLNECREPHFEWYEDPDCENVTAWAYLPEPYREEQ